MNPVEIKKYAKSKNYTNYFCVKRYITDYHNYLWQNCGKRKK